MDYEHALPKSVIIFGYSKRRPAFVEKMPVDVQLITMQPRHRMDGSCTRRFGMGYSETD